MMADEFHRHLILLKNSFKKKTPTTQKNNKNL
jgi:hypothetical protein